MRVDPFAPVILRIDEPEVWHLPQPRRELHNHLEISLDVAMQRTVSAWPALCDGEKGELFVYAGFVARRHLCAECARINAGAPHLVVPSESAAIAAYDRRREHQPDLEETAA